MLGNVHNHPRYSAYPSQSFEQRRLGLELKPETLHVGQPMQYPPQYLHPNYSLQHVPMQHSLQHLQQIPPSEYPLQDLSYSRLDIPDTFPPADPAVLTPVPKRRFHFVLEAPTAAARRVEEVPLTYLNKNQYYTINLTDCEKHPGLLTSTIKITFHDENHRRKASTYWKFWFKQQSPSKSIRAMELEAGTNVTVAKDNPFDRVTFSWPGHLGAQIRVKFNCLSTDFSRIKGVKGYSMRIQIDTLLDNVCVDQGFAQIKLFRDKGAERKNKDDSKHMVKQFEKGKGKNNDGTPRFMVQYAPSQPTTVIMNVPSTEGEDADPVIDWNAEDMDDDWDSPALDEDTAYSGHLKSLDLSNDPLDYDPSYVPRRYKTKVPCIYVKLYNEQVYRAIYLETRTVDNLVTKICQKFNRDPTRVVAVQRRSRIAKGLPHAGNVVASPMTDQLVECLDDQSLVTLSWEGQSNGLRIVLMFAANPR